MNKRSHLVRMHIKNIGCIGNDGLTIELDDIVCLVGANNAGKTTVLRAYELAVKQEKLSPNDINSSAGDNPAVVELWVHIPENTGNISDDWKEKTEDGLLLVRSKWEWAIEDGYKKPERKTWDPTKQEYAEDGKAAGLDTVFNSRLPKPFRIGSLDNPQEEQKQLLKLVLEPIVAKYQALMLDTDSSLSKKIKELSELAAAPVLELRSDIETIQNQINASYNKVFNTAQIKLNISIGDLNFDPAKILEMGSSINISESDSLVRWDQQGTGSQRTLFWSLLQVRSELNRKADLQKEIEKKKTDLKKLQNKSKPSKKDQEKTIELEKLISTLENKDGNDDISLPGYMLLIDEPETALHPSAVRAAKEHLYRLAEEDGWQVMLSTHHPVFVDPVENHTTIVRLHRQGNHLPPNIYRTEEMSFSTEELDNLKALMLFDSSVSEMFFNDKIIIVEGDTEFAAFSEILRANKDKYPINENPLIIRARGKATIAILVKILTHFKINFSVLHDIDSPRTSSGEKKNSAYSINKNIATEIENARNSGRSVVYRCSCPNFEEHHKMELPKKDKPFNSWKAVQENTNIKNSVTQVLDILMNMGNSQCTDPDDGINYENILKDWINKNSKQNEACYHFED